MAAILLLLSLILVGGIGVQTWAATIFHRQVQSSIHQIRAAPSFDWRPADPSSTPVMVRQFAEHSGATTDSPYTSIRLRQSAELRMGPDKAWIPISAEQFIRIKEPGFVWYAEQRRGPIRIMRIVDAYVESKGFLIARLLGSIPVAGVAGPGADLGELMRYIAEIAWAPDAILQNSALSWREIDDSTVEVAATSNGGVARVALGFDEDGDIVEMNAKERGRAEGNSTLPTPWRGFFSNYRDIGGRRVPTHGEVGWVLESGYQAYWRGDITEYELLRE